MRAAIDETRLLQNEYDRLNRSRAQGDIDDETYELESDRIEREFKVFRTQGATNLTLNQRDTFVDLRQRTRGRARIGRIEISSLRLYFV